MASGKTHLSSGHRLLLPRPPGLHPPPPLSVWPGIQVKREPLADNPPSAPSLPLKRLNHQLQHSQSISLEKQLERAINSAHQLHPPTASTPPHLPSTGFFGSPATPSHLFLGTGLCCQGRRRRGGRYGYKVHRPLSCHLRGRGYGSGPRVHPHRVCQKGASCHHTHQEPVSLKAHPHLHCILPTQDADSAVPWLVRGGGEVQKEEGGRGEGEGRQEPRHAPPAGRDGQVWSPASFSREIPATSASEPCGLPASCRPRRQSE